MITQWTDYVRLKEQLAVLGKLSKKLDDSSDLHGTLQALNTQLGAAVGMVRMALVPEVAPVPAAPKPVKEEQPEPSRTPAWAANGLSLQDRIQRMLSAARLTAGEIYDLLRESGLEYRGEEVAQALKNLVLGGEVMKDSEKRYQLAGMKV